jgi:hypothetical protein
VFIHYNAPVGIIEPGDKGFGIIDGKGSIDLLQDAIDLLLPDGAVFGVPGYMVGSALGLPIDLDLSPGRLMNESGTGKQQHT